MSTPKRDDEVMLWNAFGENGSVHTSPRAAGAALDIHPRRVVYLCTKWTRQGRYDYGVAADMGWKVATTDTRLSR